MDTLDVILIGKRNETVPAIIRPIDLFNDILLWYGQWFPKMYDMSGQPLYEDSHWKVPEKFDVYNANKDYKILLLEALRKIQGYVIVNINHVGIDGKRSIYVPFVATAPWNRKSSINAVREFKDTGKLLIAVSILIGKTFSDTLNLELHSLPNAEGFYRALGFKETGRVKNEMKEFRIDKNEAFDLLRFLLPHLKVGGQNE